MTGFIDAIGSGVGLAETSSVEEFIRNLVRFFRQLAQQSGRLGPRVLRLTRSVEGTDRLKSVVRRFLALDLLPVIRNCGWKQRSMGFV